MNSVVITQSAAKSLQSCPTLQPHRWQPTRLPYPWDSPGKNIGVGCHFLLQCMKVKSESEVVQSCLTLSDPMDCSLPGSSAHGIFQATVLEWVAIAFSSYGPIRVIFPASCSWRSEVLFGQFYSHIAPPIQAFRVLPCLGSFSVFQHVRHIEGPP